MKITPKLLSIPPYISTSWRNIIALHVRNEELIISLSDGEVIKIPGLSTDTINSIFLAHSSYIEHEAQLEAQQRENSPTNMQPPPFIQALMAADNHNLGQMRVGFTSFDEAGLIMQHNPAQADAPDIPFEILQKIAAIAKILAPESGDLIPQAEPNCNCMHCQLSRAIHGGDTIESMDHTIQHRAPADKEVPFEPWEVKQTEDKLFQVTNKQDPSEHYNVFLGDPIGCTCGVNGCAHILAVLRS